jgi:hypothetical protein
MKWNNITLEQPQLFQHFQEQAKLIFSRTRTHVISPIQIQVNLVGQ